MELVEYNNGRLTWKVKTHRPQQKIGDRAGSQTHNKGYRTIRLDKVLYLEHRIVWIYHNGRLLKHQMIDHINEDKIDNRIENLRVCNNMGNMRNRGKQKNNTSGYKGVTYHVKLKKWAASIGGKYIGVYQTPELAAAAYNEKATIIHKEFANLNIIK